jgi:hypothetical protein
MLKIDLTFCWLMVKIKSKKGKGIREKLVHFSLIPLYLSLKLLPNQVNHFARNDNDFIRCSTI